MMQTWNMKCGFQKARISITPTVPWKMQCCAKFDTCAQRTCHCVVQEVNGGSTVARRWGCHSTTIPRRADSLQVTQSTRDREKPRPRTWSVPERTQVVVVLFRSCHSFAQFHIKNCFYLSHRCFFKED